MRRTKGIDRRRRVDLETGEIVPRSGAASSSSCPRAGSVILERDVLGPGTGRVLMNTNCNTWRCLGCRTRLLNLFKMRVETGISTLGQCMFITVTYKQGSPRLDRVACVSKDWRALSTRLRRSQVQISKWSWFRVMELTKAGTPHHHLIAGNIDLPKVNCWGTNEEFEIKAYQKRFDSCECVAHRVAREWYGLTGDSYIVHANWVTSAVKGANYLAKYLGKEFDVPRAAALGMARRWSSSRDWPGHGRLRLLQTERGWDRVGFADGHLPDEVLGGPDYLTARNGNDLTASFVERASRKRFESLVRRKTDHDFEDES